MRIAWLARRGAPPVHSWLLTLQCATGYRGRLDPNPSITLRSSDTYYRYGITYG